MAHLEPDIPDIVRTASADKVYKTSFRPDHLTIDEATSMKPISMLAFGGALYPTHVYLGRRSPSKLPSAVVVLGLEQRVQPVIERATLGPNLAIHAPYRSSGAALGLPGVPLIDCTDSHFLYECLVRLGTTKEKWLMIDIMALRQ